MHFEVAVVGGGIAGVSCAAYLAPRVTVAVLEAESALGYHSTGRSAAIYTECSEIRLFRQLAYASKPYFTERDEPLGTKLTVLYLDSGRNRKEAERHFEVLHSEISSLKRISPEKVSELIPVILPEENEGGTLEPDALVLDIHGIQASFASTLREHGGTTLTSSPVTNITREGSTWSITAGSRNITADTIVNAAGAWGDVVAEMAGAAPLGLTPFKRSAFTFDPNLVASEWPFVVGPDQEWYMKPEGPFVLGSAASEIPEEPSDARHDELDVALGIENINEATTLSIRSIKNQWAGFRTFTADRMPGVGYDDGVEGFFWLVGQGGDGIYTSPALGETAASLILDGVVPENVASYGVTPEVLDPVRLR